MIPSGILTSVSSSAGTYLLDIYPGALAAYSLRKLSSTYTGAAIRVRRDFDNAQTDIGFDSLGNLDTTALILFTTGSNSRIVTWYDQSGNSRNATSASPPFIVLNGVLYTLNGKASAFWLNGQNQYLRTTSFSAISQPISVFSVSKLAAASGINASCLFDSYNGSGTNAIALINTGFTETPNNTSYFDSGTPYNLGASNTNTNLITTIFNNTNSFAWYNNVVKANNVTTGSNTLSGISIGNVRVTAYYNIYDWSGYISELVYYPTNQSANRTAIESNINTYYTIF